MHHETAISSDSNSRAQGLRCVTDYVHDGVVERLVAAEGLTHESAVLLFEDLQRFLVLCGTSTEKLIPPKRIDAAWHTFLLFTRDYAAFCTDRIGAFVHHNPRRPSENEANMLAHRTRKLAESHWGELSPNWSFASGASDCPVTCED